MSAMGAMRCVALAAMVVPATVSAAEWAWHWPADAADGKAPTAEITTYLYGKEWAYTVEIDDAPRLTLDVAQPLLAKQQFTDAPPGMAGGRPMPLVGGAAVMGLWVGAHENYLSWDDLRTLRKLGWGVLNHSYYHKGRSWGNNPEILSAEHVRNDLFWMQMLVAAEVGDGRAPTHFVYPNGYTGYQQYLGEFGIISGSRSAGTSVRMPYAADAKNVDNPRNYLDEKTWTGAGKSEVMWNFPAESGPAAGQLVIDFTHAIQKPGTENHQRWEKRLEAIGSAYGMGGKDNLWSAPNTEIFSYISARRSAKLSIDGSGIRVSLPDELPGSRLTVKVQGLQGDLGELPEGAIVYRQDETVWITTPMIGHPGAPSPMPAVRRVYAGPVQSVSLEKPEKVAAVRLLQRGKPSGEYQLDLATRSPDGTRMPLVDDGQKKLPASAAAWHLYSLVPNREAILAEGIEITPEPALVQMEIWVVTP